jgi:hypothetical protein
VITVSNEKTPDSGPSVSSGNGLSYHDAIFSIFMILVNLYVIKGNIISNYIAMNWGSVNNLLLIKEAIGILVPLSILAIIYKRRNTLIGFSLIWLIIIFFMHVNLVDVEKNAHLLGETNESAFYWAYIMSLGITILLSSAVQGTAHLLKNRKQGPS